MSTTTNGTYVYVSGQLVYCGHPHIDRGYCVLCYVKLGGRRKP
jgi:hypothetical protein